MRKKVFLAICLLAVMFLVSGCMMVPGSKLESMFGNSSPVNSADNSGTVPGDDTVTISKAEYEMLQRCSKFSELADLYDIAQDYFYFSADSDKMLEYAAKGLMAGLDDPYSFYYSKEEFAQMQEDDEGEYTGIGIMVQTDIFTVTRVFKGSPAEEAGVMRGDVLYKVGDDLYVSSDTINEAMSNIRGEPGTTVNVTFLRKGEEVNFTIERRKVQTNQVESKILEPGIGYLAMYQFAGKAETEFENALNELLENGAKSLIIDLRDNYGGWVIQADYIADLFMDKGELCYLIDKYGVIDHEAYPTYDGKIDIPITILVNEMTASSSEILTGALHDCADATVVGTKTFGKGIVQAVQQLSTGAAFQITIQEYYTPGGTKVHGVGLTPDIIVERPEDDNGTYDFADLEKDIQLKKALEIAEQKLPADD